MEPNFKQLILNILNEKSAYRILEERTKLDQAIHRWLSGK